MALTPRQERFVEEYLIDLNATQAAIRAGYAPKAAQEQSSRLLSNAMVSDAVARAKAERSARLGLTADRVLAELAALGFARLGDYAEWGPGEFELINSHEVDDETRERREIIDTRAVQSVTIKEVTITTDNGEIRKVEQGIKLHDKVATLKLLGQHIGMFVEKHQTTIQNAPGETFNVEVRPVDYKQALGAFLAPADGEES